MNPFGLIIRGRKGEEKRTMKTKTPQVHPASVSTSPGSEVQERGVICTEEEVPASQNLLLDFNS